MNQLVKATVLALGVFTIFSVNSLYALAQGPNSIEVVIGSVINTDGNFQIQFEESPGNQKIYVQAPTTVVFINEYHITQTYIDNLEYKVEIYMLFEEEETLNKTEYYTANKITQIDGFIYRYHEIVDPEPGEESFDVGMKLSVYEKEGITWKLKLSSIQEYEAVVERI